MAIRDSEAVRTEWVNAWDTIEAIATDEWMQLNEDCCMHAGRCLGGELHFRLIQKAWISGKQGHGKS